MVLVSRAFAVADGGADGRFVVLVDGRFLTFLGGNPGGGDDEDDNLIVGEDGGRCVDGFAAAAAVADVGVVFGTSAICSCSSTFSAACSSASASRGCFQSSRTEDKPKW